MRDGHRLELVADVDDVRDEWSALALAAGTPFATPEWSQTWIDHLGVRDQVRLFAIRDPAERLVALLPLTVRPRRPRIVRFVGHGPGDELGPVCAPADRRMAAAGLRQALRTLRADVLLAEQLPGDRHWDALLGAQPVADTGNPVLRLHEIDDGDALLQRFGPSLIRKLGRVRRKLERAGELRVRLAVPGEQLAADVDALFDLHRGRWAPQRTDFAGPHEAFQRAFMQVAAERGWLHLLLVEVDGAPVAAVYDLRFAGRQHQYQQGRDPAWDRLSVGFLALVSAMTAAAQDQMAEYRFLRGDEGYKYDYADDDPRLQTFVIGRGAARHMVVRAGGGMRRARPVLRRWLAT